MKVLVIGGGGREHAIVHTLKKSPKVDYIWCAPGNGGIRYDAKCKNIKATDVETMVGFAEVAVCVPFRIDQMHIAFVLLRLFI